MTTRTHPEHPIWQQVDTGRFTPDEGAFWDLQAGLSDEIRGATQQLIVEGMTAEQIIAVWQLETLETPAMVQEYGRALAWWVQWIRGQPAHDVQRRRGN